MTDYLASITERQSREFDADWERRAAERRARMAANPERYAAIRRDREEAARAARARFNHRPLAAVQEAADRAERKSAGVPPSHEPSHIDLAEMHVAGLISQITDFCRAARLARENPDAIKAAWNHGAFTQGVPLKMISWPQWGRQ